MAVENFVPSIWANEILIRLRKAFVFGNIINTDYESDISGFGDSVRINEIGPITINDYTKNTDITFETLTDAQKILLIDQQKYWGFTHDDIDAVQSKPKLFNAAIDEATYALRDTLDQHIATHQANAGVTSGLGTTSTAINISSGNIIEYIGIVKQKLAENNCPTNGLFGVVEPWFVQKMEMAEITKDTDNSRVMQSGYYGEVLGFTIFMSNNVENTTATTFSKTMWGNRSAISFAMQLQKTEAGRVEKQFGDFAKGIALYGSKTVRPNCLARLICSQGTG
jgi:hypothetical protein